MRALTLSVTIVLTCSARMASAQLEPGCVENSPERRGEIGCSLVENKLLPIATASSGRSRSQGPTGLAHRSIHNRGGCKGCGWFDSIAFAAHGAAWLMTIEA